LRTRITALRAVWVLECLFSMQTGWVLQVHRKRSAFVRA
jgi:hypothetical protein